MVNIIKTWMIPAKEEANTLFILLFVFFPVFHSLSLQFIAGPDLDPLTLFRIIEILHSTYKAGRIRIADYISFFITLLSGFRVLPGISD